MMIKLNVSKVPTKKFTVFLKYIFASGFDDIIFVIFLLFTKFAFFI